MLVLTLQFYPRWIAPNRLTLVGWTLMMGLFFIESVKDYRLDRNSFGRKK